MKLLRAHPVVRAAMCFLVCLLSASARAAPATADRVVFPEDPSVLHLQRDFGAKGDGETDDTAALQAAIEASCSRGTGGGTKILFMPNGTYRVTSALVVNAAVGPWIYGESRDGVIIRLADGAPSNVSCVLRTHPSDTQASSADFFMRNFRHLTIDVGRNPHVDGVRWYGNNSSILKDVRITGSGRVGVNAGFLGQNGPSLIQDVLVDGSFETGVRCAWSWGQTLSRVTVRNARQVGVYVNATAVGIEDLVVENTPIALHNEYPNDWTWWGGVVALVGGRFSGGDPAQPAITNSSVLYARDVTARGFKQVLHSTTPGGSVSGTKLDEYLSHPTKKLFPDAPDTALKLPVRTEPLVPWETNLSNWGCVNDHGAKFGDNQDDTAALQAAIDAAAEAGKTVVFLRGIGGGDPNWYNLEGEVRVHGSVRLILGLGFGRIIGGEKGRFIVDDTSAPMVKFMHLQAFGGRPPIVENRSRTNTLVVESCDFKILGTGGGDIFVTDCPSSVELRSPGQRLWARQLNPEGDSDMGLVQNHGGQLWALGVKHEGRGVRFLTDSGGQTEILGLFNYAPDIASDDFRPAFDIRDAAFSAAGIREISFGKTYHVKVREQRGEDVRTEKDGGWIGWALFRGGATPPASAVQPAAGITPAFPLKVSDNRRFLVGADGQPFFWLGDTAWELFHRLNREEVAVYLDDRAAKGFNVIQAVALAELNGLTEPNRYGHLPLQNQDPARPAVKDGPANDYWDFVDEVLDLAEAKGLYVGFLPTWGKYVTSSPFEGKVDGIFNAANAEAYGRFLGERHRHRSNVIWILGGDKAPSTPEAVAIWRAMAKGIAMGVAGREDYDAVLMTYHTSGPGHVSDYLHDEPWLDFTSAQSSHGDLVESWRFIEKHWNRQPVKPVIDLESSYPGALIPAAWLPPPLRAGHRSTRPATEDDARRAAYWAVFAGAFGHTYGHSSIWQMYEPPRKPVGNPRLTWREALAAPSATHMGYLRGLIESRPFLTQAPDPSLLADGGGEGLDRVVALRGDGYALVYTPTGKPFRVRLDKLTGKQVKAWWFDPRTGKPTAAGQFKKEGQREFTPPGKPGPGNDWVLALDDPQRGLGPPRVALEPFDWRGFGGFDTYAWCGFLLANNRWGGGNGRIGFKDHGDRWSFWTEHADDLNGGHVKSFPHAGIGWMWGRWAPNKALPIPLGELAVAKSDWRVTLPAKETHQSYVVYYQLYTATAPDPKNDASKISGDLAIIIHREDFPFEAWGKNLGEFDVGGRKWRVVHKAPAIGQSTYIIMLPATPIARREGDRLFVEDFDLKPCIDFCVARGFYQPTDYLLTIQAGWESRVLHGVLRSDDLKLTVGKRGAEPVRLPLAAPVPGALAPPLPERYLDTGLNLNPHRP